MNNNLIESNKISSIQLGLINITYVLSTSDVFLPAFVAKEAKQDSWISVLIATMSSLLIVFIQLAISNKYPNKTITQYSCDILGRFLGKFIGVLYVYFYFFAAYAVTRELGEIFVISFNPVAPISVYSIFTITIAGYAVYKGITAIARINTILLPLGIFVLMFIACINIPIIDLNYFLPVMYKGIKPVLKGSILIQTWLIETFIILQLIPYVKDKKSVNRNIIASVIFLSLSLQVGVMTIGIFGPLTGKVLFPALQFAKYSSIGYYIKNLDISIMAVWVSGIFIKISVSYYLTVLSLSQLLELKSYKQYIIPIGILIMCFSILAANSISELIYELHYIVPFYIFTMTAIIPALLLIISLVKDNLFKEPSSKTNTNEEL